MRKSFKQVSTGLTLVCEREDVIAQYEKYPDQYIPLDDPRNKKAPRTTPKTQDAPDENPGDAEQAPDEQNKPEKK